jgi:hypothetical protein
MKSHSGTVELGYRRQRSPEEAANASQLAIVKMGIFAPSGRRSPMESASSFGTWSAAAAMPLKPERSRCPPPSRGPAPQMIRVRRPAGIAAFRSTRGSQGKSPHERRSCLADTRPPSRRRRCRSTPFPGVFRTGVENEGHYRRIERPFNHFDGIAGIMRAYVHSSPPPGNVPMSMLVDRADRASSVDRIFLGEADGSSAKAASFV